MVMKSSYNKHQLVQHFAILYKKKESFEKHQPYVKYLLEHLSSCKQVMVVSSVWHGVHPGYYLGLGSVSAREH